MKGATQLGRAPRRPFRRAYVYLDAPKVVRSETESSSEYRPAAPTAVLTATTPANVRARSVKRVQQAGGSQRSVWQAILVTQCTFARYLDSSAAADVTRKRLQGMHHILRLFVAVTIALASASAAGQCAPGIPSAGNPACIPPDQDNSPYYQGDAAPDVNVGPAPIWKYHWGAIAGDRGNGSQGFAINALSKRQAKEIALEDCRAHGGKNCVILFEYGNQCAAVAQVKGGGPLGMARDETSKKAESRAMETCGEATCEIVYSVCSLPVRMN